MSIAPVQSFPPAKNEQAEMASVRPEKVASPAVVPAPPKAAPPVSVNLPKEQKPAPKIVPAKYVLPEDVVEVHQDPESKDQVTQYLDQSKNVILQVPSNEELSVERGIAQELQQAAKLRATADAAAATSDQGKTHGD
jgi:hypothetical protein